MDPNTYVQIKTVEPSGVRRFWTVLYALMGAYAAVRSISFAGPWLIGGRGAAVPSAIESTISLQVWTALWTAGALLHFLAIRWDWAARATMWTFSIKGSAVAIAFVWSAVRDGGSVPASLGGLMSYGVPVIAFWMILWSFTLRPRTLIQAIPTLDSGVVADAARDQIRVETGEIPEVDNG